MEGPSTNLKEKFSVFGEKLKLGSGELSRKMTERMSTVSEKMKELFQVPTQADKLVEDATGENLEFADWEKNLEICDLVNLEKVSGQDTARAIKKRIMLKSSTHVQYLALTLLETCVKNCEKMFSEVASEKVLDEMVKMVDDPASPSENRDKALKLIEAWGESTEELRYLPVFEETYKSLKSRGIRFPGRDEESLAPIFTPPQSVARSAGSEALYGSGGGAHAQPPSRDLSASVGHDMRFEVTKEVVDVARNSVDLLNTVLTSSPQQEVLKEELTMTLVEQCRSSQFKVQRIVESTGDADPVLFEALNVNDDLQRVLTKYEEMLKGVPAEQQQQQQQQQQQAAQPVAHVQALEEEDSHHGPEEENSLVRKRETKPSAPPTSAHDDAAIADLDEMIFGNRPAEGSSNHSQTPKRQNTEDMIMF